MKRGIRTYKKYPIWKSELGAFYTNSKTIVDFMVNRLCLERGLDILEPCAGEGVFIKAILEKNYEVKITTYDIDPKAIEKLKKNFGNNITIFQKDTLLEEEALFNQFLKGFDRIIANPPYGAIINQETRKRYQRLYSDFNISESYGLFFLHAIKNLKNGGRLVFITPDTYLNLHSHTKLRKFILDNCLINEIALLPSRLFPEVNFQYAGLAITTLTKMDGDKFRNIREKNVVIIISVKNEAELKMATSNNLEKLKRQQIIQKNYLNSPDFIFYRPIPLSLEKLILNKKALIVGDLCECKTGLYTGNNKRYIRVLSSYPEKTILLNRGYKEVTPKEIRKSRLSKKEQDEGIINGPKFIPYMKGMNGAYIPSDVWYINWSKEAIEEIKKDPKARFQNSQFYFKKGICMPVVCSNVIKAKIKEGSAVFDQADNGYFCDSNYIFFLLAFFNSQLFSYILKKVINPSANNTVNYIKKIPIIIPSTKELNRIDKLMKRLIEKRIRRQNFERERMILDEIFFDLFNINKQERLEIQKNYQTSS